MIYRAPAISGQNQYPHLSVSRTSSFEHSRRVTIPAGMPIFTKSKNFYFELDLCLYAPSLAICTDRLYLASGSSAVIKITVIVDKTAKTSKELVNNAFVSSATFDPNLSNNAVVQKTLVATK